MVKRVAWGTTIASNKMDNESNFLPAPTQFANFSTDAANATKMGTLPTIAGQDHQQHPQLQAATFKPVTLLRPDLEIFLHSYPN